MIPNNLIINAFFENNFNFSRSCKNPSEIIEIKVFLDFLLEIIILGKNKLEEMGESYECIDDTFYKSIYLYKNHKLERQTFNLSNKESDIEINRGALGDFINATLNLMKKKNINDKKEDSKKRHLVFDPGFEEEKIKNILFQLNG